RRNPQQLPLHALERRVGEHFVSQIIHYVFHRPSILSPGHLARYAVVGSATVELRARARIFSDEPSLPVCTLMPPPVLQDDAARGTG
ncbi:MAG TPA: hypothetical protein VGK73_37670, partial [Polyangiaceae bacterium]